MKSHDGLRIGDIFLNPIMRDLWILRRDIFEDEKEESWVLSLVHCDLIEKYDYVKDFIKVGNIYDLLNNQIKNNNRLVILKRQRRRYRTEMIKCKHTLHKIKEIMNEDDSADNIYIHLRDYLEEKLK